ncbi:unnamed protein product [Lampetra planeri]
MLPLPSCSALISAQVQRRTADSPEKVGGHERNETADTVNDEVQVPPSPFPTSRRGYFRLDASPAAGVTKQARRLAQLPLTARRLPRLPRLVEGHFCGLRGDFAAFEARRQPGRGGPRRSRGGAEETEPSKFKARQAKRHQRRIVIIVVVVVVIVGITHSANSVNNTQPRAARETNIGTQQQQQQAEAAGVRSSDALAAR